MLVTMRLASNILNSNFFESLALLCAPYPPPASSSSSSPSSHPTTSPIDKQDGGIGINGFSTDPRDNLERKRFSVHSYIARKTLRRAVASQDKLAEFCDAHFLPEPEYTLRVWTGEPIAPIQRACDCACRYCQLKKLKSLESSLSRNKTVSPLNLDSGLNLAASVLRDNTFEVGEEGTYVDEEEMKKKKNMDDNGNEESHDQSQITSIPTSTLPSPSTSSPISMDNNPPSSPSRCSSHTNNNATGSNELELSSYYGFREQLYTCVVKVRIPGGYDSEEKVFAFETPRGVEYEIAGEAREAAARVALEVLRKCKEFG